MDLTKQVIDENPYPMYVKNKDGKLILANAAYAALHGVSSATLLQTGELEFDFAFNRDLEVITSGAGTCFEEYYKLQDNREIWFHTVKKPFRNTDGSHYLLSISSDITNLKSGSLKSQKQAYSREDFLTQVSSEIRHSIHAMQDLAGLLKDSLHTHNQKEYISSILTITDNLSFIPDLVSAFAQLESDPKQSETINLSSLIQEIVKTFNNTVDNTNLQLQIAKSDTFIPEVEGDSKRLSQLLKTLVYGLMKAAKNATIKLTATTKENLKETVWVEFRISIREPETAGKNLRHELENLSRPVNNNYYLYSETGIELYLCKSLAEYMGGKLNTDMRKQQEANVYLRLPFQTKGRVPLTEAGKAPTASEKLDGLHILLAEDNLMNQVITTSYLRAWNIAVDIVPDGEEAVKKTAEKAYDLILMDIEMPRLNGIETTSRIRSMPNQNSHAPIIAFTANDFKYEFEQYISLGFTDCLLKPFHETRLYTVIKKNTGKLTPKQESDMEQHTQQGNALYSFSGLGAMADDTVFVRKLKQLFIQTAPEQLQKLHKAHEQKDWNTVAIMAHQLKSTFGNISMSEAAEAMKEAEKIATDNSDLLRLPCLLKTASEMTFKVIALFTKELKSSD